MLYKRCDYQVVVVCVLLSGTAAFIDAEHAMDPVYARNLGVKVDDLLLCQVRVSVRGLLSLRRTADF